MNKNSQEIYNNLSVSHSVSNETTPSAPSNRISKCFTRIDPVQISQYWKIENAGSIIKLSVPGNCMRSNVFRESNQSEAYWQLCLYPAGKRVENANHVSLFLKMSSTSPTKEFQIKVEYRFYFLNERDFPVFSNVNVGEFHAKPPKGGHSWGLRNIPRQKVLNCLRSDDSLVIYCQIELIPDIAKAKCLSKNTLYFTRKLPICHEYVKQQEMALETGVQADCMLECNGQLIPVNRFCLCVHSKVFNAMFSYENMLENKEKRVVIEDTDVESVKMMLKYMYCGYVDLGTNAEEVLKLAERYQLDQLKLMCEEKISTNVDRNNVVDMLLFADLYNCKWLKSIAVEVLRTNKSYILKTAAWQNLKETNPALVTEVMEEVLLDDCDSPPLKRKCDYVMFFERNGIISRLRFSDLNQSS